MAYNQTPWTKGDVLTAEKLNKIETQLARLDAALGETGNESDPYNTIDNKIINKIGQLNVLSYQTIKTEYDSDNNISSINKQTISFPSGQKLTLIDSPTTNKHAANKEYVDTTINASINALDSVVTGAPDVNQTLTAFSQTDGKVTATFGNIQISENAVTNLVTDLANLNTTKAPVANPVFTGTVTLSGAPNTDLEAATKKYVDDGIKNTLSSFKVSTANSVTVLTSNTKYEIEFGNQALKFQTPPDTTYNEATSSTAGLMSTSAFNKLSSLPDKYMSDNLPEDDGEYVLKLVKEGNNYTYQWQLINNNGE